MPIKKNYPEIIPYYEAHLHDDLAQTYELDSDETDYEKIFTGDDDYLSLNQQITLQFVINNDKIITSDLPNDFEKNILENFYTYLNGENLKNIKPVYIKNSFEKGIFYTPEYEKNAIVVKSLKDIKNKYLIHYRGGQGYVYDIYLYE